jgi:hypothetical protein
MALGRYNPIFPGNISPWWFFENRAPYRQYLADHALVKEARIPTSNRTIFRKYNEKIPAQKVKSGRGFEKRFSY